jgi:adenylate cyclase
MAAKGKAIKARRSMAELEAELEKRTAERDEALAERDEAAARESAAGEVLSVINSSPGDLAPVFDAILEKAHSLCGVVHGALVLGGGEHFRAVATHGLPEPLAERLREGFRAAGSPIVGPLLEGAQFFQIPDLAEVDHPAARQGTLAGIRTLLIVALRRDGALSGWIAAGRQGVRPFSEKEIALLQNFAAQAVIAMENARLITETREALEQQTATAEVLGVINSSPGDLAPVFDAMIERATRLCEAELGTLWTFDGDRFHPTVSRGLSDPGFGGAREGVRPGRNLPLGRLIAGESIVHVIDAASDPGFQSDNVGRTRTAAAGARSNLTVALRKDDTLLGAITTGRKRVQPYSDKQIALLQNFAAQAVIAMENARLLTETREALERQTATAEVLQVINSSPGDLAPVFDAILEKAHNLCGAGHGSLMLRDGDHFRAVALRGVPEPLTERLLSGFLGSAAPASKPLLAGDRYVHILDLAQSDSPVARAAVEFAGTHTLLSVPLRKGDELLGMIVATRPEIRAFSEKEIALLENFAAQAVIAMENARLLGELRQRNDEIAGWNKELEDRVAAQLGELERVGKLKRFLAPQLAELIVARGDEAVLETHRRDIVVVFCDLRDFTAFAETAEPEEVLDLLREYHGALGPIVSGSEGTLDHFSGDGIMVFFNDPVPVADASERAVKMAIEMRAAMDELQQEWRRQGRRIGFGAGIARGYATLGQIGFADRIDYTAIGTVCNLAARLCAEAKDGQILVSQRVAAAVEQTMPLEDIGEVTLKGLSQPVAVYNVPLTGGQSALRVIEGGAPSA